MHSLQSSFIWILLLVSQCNATFTYQGIKALFPQILQRTHDNVGVQRIIDDEILKYMKGDQRDISDEYDQCKDLIFDDKFLDPIPKMTSKQCQIHSEKYADAIKTVKECKNVPLRHIQYFGKQLCAKMRSTELQQLRTDFRSRLLRLTIMNVLYPKYVNLFSDWFKSALDWIQDQKEFNINRIFTNAGLAFFKAYLRQYYHVEETKSSKIISPLVLNAVVDYVSQKYRPSKQIQPKTSSIIKSSVRESVPIISEAEELFTYDDVKGMFPTILQRNHVNDLVFRAIKRAILGQKPVQIKESGSRERGRRRCRKEMEETLLFMDESEDEANECVSFEFVMKDEEEQRKVNAVYPEWVQSISTWFVNALDSLQQGGDFKVRQITQRGGAQEFRVKLEEYLKHETNEKLTDNSLIHTIAEDIVSHRLKEFSVYDQLIMFKVPRNEYSFDSLMKHGASLSEADGRMNRKLQEMKRLFEQQDDERIYSQWETVFVYELYVADEKAPKPIDDQTFMDSKKEWLGTYCPSEPEFVLGPWANCADSIAIKAYTDKDSLQGAFRRSFRCDVNDPESCNLYKWVAWKMQLERAFRKRTIFQRQAGRKEEHVFLYHGLGDRCFDWQSLRSNGFAFSGPLSTSTQMIIAANFADKGVLLKMSFDEGNKYRPFDVTGISFETDEEERTLYDGRVTIVAIRDIRVAVSKEMCTLKLRGETPPKYDQNTLTASYDRTELERNFMAKYDHDLADYVLRMNDYNEQKAEDDAQRLLKLMEELDARCGTCKHMSYKAKIDVLEQNPGDIEEAAHAAKKRHLEKTTRYGESLCQWVLNHHEWNEQNAAEYIDTANELMVELSDTCSRRASIGNILSITEQMNLLQKHKFSVKDAAADTIFTNACLLSRGFGKTLTDFLLDRRSKMGTDAVPLSDLLADARFIIPLSKDLRNKCPTMTGKNVYERRLQLLHESQYNVDQAAASGAFKKLCLKNIDETRKYDHDVIDFVVKEHNEWGIEELRRYLTENAQDLTDLLHHEDWDLKCGKPCAALNNAQKLEVLKKKGWSVSKAIKARDDAIVLTARSELRNYYEYRYNDHEYTDDYLARKYRLANKLLNLYK
eukprot:308779_1